MASAFGDRAVKRSLDDPLLAIAIVCGLFTSAVLIGAAIYGKGHGLGVDFNVFWRAGHTPLGQIYAPNPFDPFIYPPPSLLWVIPIGQLPFWPALLLWWGLSLSTYGYAVRSSTWLLFASPIVIQCLIFGQTSLVLAAFALFAARQEGWKRGALLGLIFSTKPQLVILAPLVLLARRDWTGLLGLVAVGLAEVIVSAALFGPQMWLDWASAFPAFRETVANNDLWGVMVTPFAYAMRVGINPWPVFIAGASLAVIAAIRSKNSNPVELACLCSLLATPYAVANDLAVLLPFAICRLLDREATGKPWAAIIYSTAFPPVALAWGAIQFLSDTAQHKAKAAT